MKTQPLPLTPNSEVTTVKQLEQITTPLAAYRQLMSGVIRNAYDDSDEWYVRFYLEEHGEDVRIPHPDKIDGLEHLGKKLGINEYFLRIY